MAHKRPGMKQRRPTLSLAALTGEHFHDQICRLWKHTKGKPDSPATNIVPQQLEPSIGEYVLRDEIELVEGIAYVAAVKKGVDCVSASAIGLPFKPHDGILIYIASNDGVDPSVQRKLQGVVEAMQDVANRAISTRVTEERIFDAVLEMNATRINARLRANHSRKAVVTIGLQDICLRVEYLSQHDNSLTVLKNRLASLHHCLHDHRVEPKSRSSLLKLKALVLACHKFWTEPGDESTHDMLVRAGENVRDMDGDPYLRQVAKIAAYCHIPKVMVAHASSRRLRQLFQHITVRYIPFYDPVSQFTPAAIAGGGVLSRVHAEVQLIIELDSDTTSKWSKPRAIGSSKAACFLCNLFMQKHGEFFVPRSHGGLTPFWAIPDSSRITKMQRAKYRSIIADMSTELLKATGLACQHRLDPAMSWQALSRLRLLCYSQESLALTISKSVIGRLEAEQSDRTGVASENLAINMSLAQTGGLDSAERLLREGRDGEQVLGLEKDLLNADVASMTASCHNSLSCTELMPKNHNVECQQKPTHDDYMKDHESRACKGSSVSDARVQHRRSRFRASDTFESCWTDDFHEIELFFSGELPTSTVVHVQPDELLTSSSCRVIDISRLQYHHVHEVDFGTSRVDERRIFLKARTKCDDSAGKWLRLEWINRTSKHAGSAHHQNLVTTD